MSKMFKVRPLTEKSAEAWVRLGTNPYSCHTPDNGALAMHLERVAWFAV